MGHLATAVMLQEVAWAQQRLLTWPLDGSCKSSRLLGFAFSLSSDLEDLDRAQHADCCKSQLPSWRSLLWRALGPQILRRHFPHHLAAKFPRKSSASSNLTCCSVPSRLRFFLSSPNRSPLPRWFRVYAILIVTLERMVCLFSHQVG